VSELASEAGERLRLPECDVVLLRRAGWLHDVGKVGLSAAIWHQDAPGSQHDIAASQLHAAHARAILAAPASLRALGDVAALHHERVDGSGYPNGLRGDTRPVVARVLEAANAYCEAIEKRGAVAADGAGSSTILEPAASALRDDASAGRFDKDIVGAVRSGSAK
jgi:HD-GYP domain-containing protein (c-di-GMP phosphodiesterase class II)